MKKKILIFGILLIAAVAAHATGVLSTGDPYSNGDWWPWWWPF